MDPKIRKQLIKILEEGLKEEIKKLSIDQQDRL